jgi:hypothetical protein
MKIVVKGVMTVEDALASVRHGVDGIWVSNHGARQLDTVPATIEGSYNNYYYYYYYYYFIRYSKTLLTLLATNCGVIFNVLYYFTPTTTHSHTHSNTPSHSLTYIIFE